MFIVTYAFYYMLLSFTEMKALIETCHLLKIIASTFIILLNVYYILIQIGSNVFFK